jgi:hypothetical protein
LGGCPTEAETETVYVTADPEMIHIDVLASNEGELNQYLAEEGDLVIGVGSTITLVAALEIPEGKVVYILNSGKLSTAAGFGLTVKGTVYVGIGGELDVSAAAAALTGEGKVSVLKSSYTPPADVAATGTLTISAATDVNNGGTTVLGTEQVPILGTLKYSAGATFADPAAVVAALAYVPKGTLDVGDVVEVKAFLPSAVATAATGKVSAGQLLFATANGVETATTLTVPAGLVLTTTDGLGTVTTLTVNSGLIAGSAVLEDDPGATITVGAGAYAELGTVAKVLADSSVGAGGTLTAVVTAFGDDATIAAAEGSTVNGITFPGATTVSAAAANALTIGDLTVPADGTLTVPAGKTVTVGTLLEVNGTLAFTDNTSKVILSAGASLKASATGVLSAKAGTADGSGVVLTVAATSDLGAATGFTTSNATAPAPVTVTKASANSGTGSNYAVGNASFAINNILTAAAEDGLTSTKAGTAAAGEIKAGTDSAVVLIGKS